MFCPNTMMEALGLGKLVEEKIKDQQRSKSTLVPFRPMVPQSTQNPPAPRTTPRICLNKRCGNIGKKGFVIIVMRNSLGYIDVLSKSSISWMWILHQHLKFFMMLRIPQMMMVTFNNFLLQRTNQRYLSMP